MSAADLIVSPPVREPARHSITTRVVIYGLLVVFALVYIVPLVVMVMTSLKPLDEVTGGNMFALPHHLTFDPWVQAWGEARIGVSDTAGIKGYFWNSIKMVVPAVLISTLLGASERLRADEVALSRPQARIRDDAVRLLYPVPISHHSDGGHSRRARPHRQSVE